MRPQRLHRALSAAIVLVTSSVVMLIPRVPAQASTYCHATMGGTFVPMDGWAATWNTARTDQEMAGMQGAGIRQIILQNAVDLNIHKAWYPQSRYPQGTNVVGNVASLAQRHNMSLVLGLANDTTWWQHATDPTWLMQHARSNEAIADDLYRYVGPSIQAWYIPEEVDDYNMAYGPDLAPLKAYFTELTTYLHSHDGNKPVVSSPYFQGLAGLTTDAYAAALRQTLTGVDVVNLQDGGGELYIGGYRSPAAITSLFQSVRNAFRGVATIWDDPDLYRMRIGPFPPVPLQANLNAVCGLATFITGFSYPSQLDPLNGETWWYNAYLSYLQHG
ncbi:MAG: DUF4434 domain-containing protein [Actinomycetota bacterium]|nr:DUF4434 domain-containing protein [Actinomycetota bacterium]